MVDSEVCEFVPSHNPEHEIYVYRAVLFDGTSTPCNKDLFI